LPDLDNGVFARPVSKLNNSGSSYNRRILVVDDELVGYISKIPADYTNDTIPEKQVMKK